jgi:hypothetical protein
MGQDFSFLSEVHRVRRLTPPERLVDPLMGTESRSLTGTEGIQKSDRSLRCEGNRNKPSQTVL